jgi:hypothetical protein
VKKLGPWISAVAVAALALHLYLEREELLLLTRVPLSILGLGMLLRALGLLLDNLAAVRVLRPIARELDAREYFRVSSGGTLAAFAFPLGAFAGKWLYLERVHQSPKSAIVKALAFLALLRVGLAGVLLVASVSWSKGQYVLAALAVAFGLAALLVFAKDHRPVVAVSLLRAVLGAYAFALVFAAIAGGSVLFGFIAGAFAALGRMIPGVPGGAGTYEGAAFLASLALDTDPTAAVLAAVISRFLGWFALAALLLIDAAIPRKSRENAPSSPT